MRSDFWVVAGLAAVSASCKPQTNAYAPPPPPEVTVANPIRRPVTQYLEYSGTCEAFQTVELRARVAGFLEKVNFKPGGKVAKGDLLFAIDDRTYRAVVDRAQAQLVSDEATLAAAESDARIASELAAQRAGSEIDKIIKTGKRDAARAAVEASRAALASAKLDLEFCEVRAPIDGRITKNFVDVGNLVGAAGQPTVLATLVSTRPIYVSVDVSETDLLAVRRSRMAADPSLEPGQIAGGQWRPVDLAISDDPSFSVHGVIDYVDPALDPQSGTIRARCRFDNEGEFLVPGLYVKVRIHLGTTDELVAPDIALLSDQGGRYALVVGDDGRVEVRRVTIGALDGTMRAIRSGLTATDRLVVNGLQRARPGGIVKATLQPLPQDEARGPSPSNAAGSSPAR
jgi:membrane fusion protein, multidrug efflux system